MLFLSGKQDEIVPQEHMVTLWNIAIGRSNPDGTPKIGLKVVKTEGEKGRESPDQPKEETTTNVAGKATTETPPHHQPQSDEPSLEEDADSKEYFEYETVDGEEVLLSKRTKYRVWRQFEEGTHSTF
jgi:hypothetical protein